MTDLANIAAVTGAGYRETATDRGTILPGPRFHCHLTKYVSGGAHQAGYEVRADGYSATSAASARGAAIAILNNQRSHRYSFAAGTSKDTLGNTLTRDVS
jgi:hypothetical protein